MAGMAIAIFVLLAVAIFSFSRMQSRPWTRSLLAPSVRPQNPRELPTWTGMNELAPERFHGKWTLLTFWTVTCPPCLQEMPAMNQLAMNWQGPEFQILTINLDKDSPSDFEAAKKFLLDESIALPTLFDHNKILRNAFSVHEYPKHFLINGNGKIIWEGLGAYAWNDQSARDQLLRLMEKQTPESGLEPEE
jgi:thiol-disulfide isomerase/thioredoxin